MATIRLPNRNRTTATAALLCSAFAWPMLAGAQTWINPGSGNWFDPINWSTAAVPLAGGVVIVSNGGTATLSGLPATPVLGLLNIGLAGVGTGTGTVTSNGVAVNAGSVLNIGTSTSAGASANGLLQINGGAGGTANSVAAGFAASSLPATVAGRLDVAGSFVVNGGNLTAGQTFGAARGSIADGVVNIGGNAGTVNFLLVGDVFSFNNDQVGSRATGAVSIGGNMALTGFALIGTAFPPDRVADAAAPGGFRFNQASGTINIGGAFSITNAATPISIGTTVGGVVDGALTVGALNMPAGGVSLNLGTSLARGQASGRLSAGSGDLRVANVATNIGITSDGTAQGRLTLGGQLLGSGGALNVGSVSGGGTLLSQAAGNVSATGGVAGFSSYFIGGINGTQVANSRAQGSVIGGAAAPASNTNFVSVGNIFNGGSSNTANGVLTLGNTLNVVNNGDFIVGQIFIAGRDSVANGVANIGGNAGTVRFFTVGEVFSSNNDQVGSRATGAVNISGDIALTGFASVGTAYLPSRVADAGAPGGFRVNQASGTVNIGGTLSIANNATSTLTIGNSQGGIVDGAMLIGAMAMGGNTLQAVFVGTSVNGGQASGTLEINGGTLRAATVQVGTTAGGTAAGRLGLTNTNLEADIVRAGAGGGSAMLLLRDSQASVAQDMTLTAGLLGLERSRLRVGNAFTLGDDVVTHVEIDGLTRGTQYGAIDALAAMLDGRIEFDFGDLLFGGASAMFDILRSGGINGIAGDFDAFSFLNLAPNYTATAGIELDAGVEVYRVRLARINAVPEPASALLLLLGLSVLAAAKKARSRRSIASPLLADAGTA